MKSSFTRILGFLILAASCLAGSEKINAAPLSNNLKSHFPDRGLIVAPPNMGYHPGMPYGGLGMGMQNPYGLLGMGMMNPMMGMGMMNPYSLYSSMYNPYGMMGMMNPMYGMMGMGGMGMMNPMMMGMMNPMMMGMMGMMNPMMMGGYGMGMGGAYGQQFTQPATPPVSNAYINGGRALNDNQPQNIAEFKKAMNASIDKKWAQSQTQEQPAATSNGQI